MRSTVAVTACGALAAGHAWYSAFLIPCPPRLTLESSVSRLGRPAESVSSALAASIAGAMGMGIAATQTKRHRFKVRSDLETGHPHSTSSACSTFVRRGSRTLAVRDSRTLHAVGMAAGGDTKVAINGFGRIGRNVLRCWLQREEKPFDITAINVGSMGAETAAHLLKYDTVLGTLSSRVEFRDDYITVDGYVFTIVNGRDPLEMPWKDLGVELVIEATGAFNALEAGSQHLEAGASKVVLTAPGTDCPTYVVGVNEEDYDETTDHVISNASCTTNGMAPVCKIIDEAFGVMYGMMTTTHSYTGDQNILDGRHKDLRRARAGALNIVPTSTGAAKAIAEVLPQFKGKLNGIAFRVPTPNVSVVDLVVRVAKKCTREDVNSVLKSAAEGPMRGIVHFEEQPLVSSDFLQTDQSSSVDAELTMVMGEDLVKVVIWYDNEWGYSQRVVDLATIVAEKLAPRED